MADTLMDAIPEYNLQHTLIGHRRAINFVQISDDGAFLASGGHSIQLCDGIIIMFFVIFCS